MDDEYFSTSNIQISQRFIHALFKLSEKNCINLMKTKLCNKFPNKSNKLVKFRQIGTNLSTADINHPNLENYLKNK